MKTLCVQKTQLTGEFQGWNAEYFGRIETIARKLFIGDQDFRRIVQFIAFAFERVKSGTCDMAYDEFVYRGSNALEFLGVPDIGKDESLQEQGSLRTILEIGGIFCHPYLDDIYNSQARCMEVHLRLAWHQRVKPSNEEMEKKVEGDKSRIHEQHCLGETRILAVLGRCQEGYKAHWAYSQYIGR